jgi:hypothetical protein
MGGTYSAYEPAARRNVVLTDSLASADRTWTVFVRNFGSTAQPFHANAVCGS